MPEFTIYDPKTGIIIRRGTCHEDDLDLQAAPGEALHVGDALSDATHMFKRGKPVEARPPLSRVDLGLAVNDERSRRKDAGTVIDGVWVNSTGWAAMRDLAFKAERRVRDGSSEPIIYRDGLNVTHTLSPENFMAVYDAADTYLESVSVHSWQIKEMAKPPADVTADELWPARTLPEI